MTKNYTNNFKEINIHKRMSKKSEIISQMIYGESFKILQKNKKWLKIKVKEDGYIGFIKNKKYSEYTKPTHKVAVLSAYIYKKPNIKNNIGKITFGSKVSIKRISSRFSKFSSNKWIESKNLKPIKFKNKDIFLNVDIFKNVKYKWGGKTFNGIDCSALIQNFLNFNNMYCPRDTKDQIKFFKKNIRLQNVRKNDILYWKGHVAVALSKKDLIHAYGPAKKTVIMKITEAIKIIKKTANLDLKSIKRIK